VNKESKKKKKYEKPKMKKEFIKPEMKKGGKFNEVIGSCFVVYGACGFCSVA
jgi:hypothetical protein